MDFNITAQNIREVMKALDSITLYPGYSNAKTFSNVIEALNGIALSIENYCNQDKNKEKS